MPVRAVFDANALYGHLIRDVLLSVAGHTSLAPCWSPRIQDEWVHHLKQRRPGNESRIDQTVAAMNRFFPDALIPQAAVDAAQAGLTVTLPDPDDLHVLACAVAARAGLLVTANLKHFPVRLLNPLSVRALSPDAFLVEMLRNEPDGTVDGIRAMRGRYRNPPTTVRDLLERMDQVGLRQLSRALADHHAAAL